MRVAAMIKVKCPGCSRTIKAADEWAGKQGNCPSCGESVTIPSASPKRESKAIATVQSRPAPTVAAANPVAVPPAPMVESRADVLQVQPTEPSDEHRNCPFCGERILHRAIKCRFCNEFLDGRTQKASPAQQIVLTPVVPTAVRFDRQTDTFTGTMTLMVKLAMRAVQELGWTLDQANESVGLVTFQTGISWGSWSGVSCSLNIAELSPNKFRVAGTGKQNLRGGQILALNIGGEAQGKASKAIDMMKQLAS